MLNFSQFEMRRRRAACRLRSLQTRWGDGSNGPAAIQLDRGYKSWNRAARGAAEGSRWPAIVGRFPCAIEGAVRLAICSRARENIYNIQYNKYFNRDEFRGRPPLLHKANLTLVNLTLTGRLDMKEAKQRAEIGLLSLAEHYKHLRVMTYQIKTDFLLWFYKRIKDMSWNTCYKFQKELLKVKVSRMHKTIKKYLFLDTLLFENTPLANMGGRNGTRKLCRHFIHKSKTGGRLEGWTCI